MNVVLEVVIALACLLGIALFSGGETGFYRVSRVRIEMEARRGSTTARLLVRLLADETALVIVLVLGLNLALEVLTHRAEGWLEPLGLTRLQADLVLTLALTPIVLFFGDLLPKDLFRRRPHRLLTLAAPVLFGFRWIAWPLERLLWLVTAFVARIFGLKGRIFEAAQGREAVLGFLTEGRKSGAIPAHAEALARNVLHLRTIPIGKCMVPWKDVVRLELAGRSNAELYDRIAASENTRLPVLDSHGECQGYVHQLDVLGAGPEEDVLVDQREILALAQDLSVDRALARMRAAGQRLALVGTRSAPVGLVTLKDLLEEISGDLAGW